MQRVGHRWLRYAKKERFPTDTHTSQFATVTMLPPLMFVGLIPSAQWSNLIHPHSSNASNLTNSDNAEIAAIINDFEIIFLVLYSIALSINLICVIAIVRHGRKNGGMP